MPQPAWKPMTLEAFLPWEAEQPRRYELVDGAPRAMAGGSQAHALIAGNVLAWLRGQLRGSGCRPYGSDLRVPIPERGNSRYPDVTVDCGRYDPASRDASEPRIVFEVLSRSTAWYDQTQKLRDYDSLPSVAQYICLSQDEMRVSVWRRTHDGRLAPDPDLTDPDAVLALVGLEDPLPLSTIYEDTLVPAAEA